MFLQLEGAHYDATTVALADYPDFSGLFISDRLSMADEWELGLGISPHYHRGVATFGVVYDGLGDRWNPFVGG
jgi:hypothetical protein